MIVHKRAKIERYIAAVPKAELHVHFEGSIQFDINTINEILLNGVGYSFLSREAKQSLEATFQAEMTKLQQELAL